MTSDIQIDSSNNNNKCNRDDNEATIESSSNNNYLLNNINYLKLLKTKEYLMQDSNNMEKSIIHHLIIWQSKYSNQIILKLHPFITHLKTSSNTQQQHSSEERNQNKKRFDVWSFMFLISLLKLLSTFNFKLIRLIHSKQ
ncbi:hypothetical protein DICPUDRAFT_76831 [Dictyostelium purpureum]|uniref:Uncharacterized protein n=1 Tax=Dictyostelium purpureum TaxID=5786 RepID=F0ZES1_DICPU|nr:uncharacterized protein DICPUDRAFT_76831 [Dictyostelium purpureum]EGC37540.1 hypothetical protein DICPUDRAFT_76831 [Dictyostelium purpureum]|eukprot:XP_003285931.1 hypothetical protein DICPUDRAFT_76831 [Dictyostelium purpureum]